jgi:hypothetical protein
MLSGRHICRVPCPVEVISNDITPLLVSTSGVLLPTHAASNQCVFERSRVVRLNFVNPPDPHSMGKSVALSLSELVPLLWSLQWLELRRTENVFT